LQVVAGYSPIAAGASLVPLTILMLLLSSRVGGLAQRIGPKIPMAAGLAVAAVGMGLMTRVGPHASYPADVLPAVVVFGLGLCTVVAPLTATVLATADERHAGMASGVNNAVARAASLLFVAAIPPLAGLTGDAQAHPAAFLHGFRVAILVSACFLVLGAALSLLTIRNDVLRTAPATAKPECRVACPIAAPPLEPGGAPGGERIPPGHRAADTPDIPGAA
jgi:MFS family permease